MNGRVGRFLEETGRESRTVLLLLGLLLAVNLATAELFPLVWLDEAWFTDPALNLASGLGLHSTAWWTQQETEVWLSYPPLWAFVLAGWIRLVGFSLVAVRGLGHLLGMAALGLSWLAVRRLGLLSSPLHRVAFVVLGACGAGTCFSYRCGRPDALLFFLVSLAFAASTIPGRASRVAALLAVGALLPLAGLQGPVYVAVLSALLVPFVAWRSLRPAATLLAGSVLGGAGAVLVLVRLGLWETFHRATLSANGLATGFLAGVATRAARIPYVAFEDLSANLLLVLCLFEAVRLLSRGGPRRPSASLLGAATAVLVPALLCAAGRWALYYAWMVWIPLVLASLRAGEDAPARSVPAGVRTAFLLCGALVGLPAQLAMGFVNRDARDYSHVEKVVDAAIPRGSVALCDPAAWYAARARASKVFLTTYRDRLTPEDIASIEGVVVRSRIVFRWEVLPRELAVRLVRVEAPKPPAARLKGLRLHWHYEDYAGLAGFRRR